MKLRAVLATEQRGICVYCERLLDEKKEAPPVEHWRPLSQSPESALCWNNLYLSCPTPDTCDDQKKYRRLLWGDGDPDLPWPTDAPYHDWLGFTHLGEVYVRADRALDEKTRKALELAISDQEYRGQKKASILNLNHRTLVAARKAAIDSERIKMEKDFPNRSVPPAERKNRADKMLSANNYPKFVSIRVAWLTKMLGKNR